MKIDIYETYRNQATQHESGLKILEEEKATGPCLKIWKPKAQKPYINYRFKNAEQRENYKQETINRYQAYKQEMERKKQSNKLTPEKIDSVKVGDIFHFSWGYEQTNCDFFEVVEKKGITLKLKELAQKRAEKETGNSMADYRLPVKGEYVNDKTITKRLKFVGETPCLNMASYGFCSLWNGQAEYCSWYA